MYLHNISHYCATTDIKPEIAHVYIAKKDNYLVTVATDSYRLAKLQYSLDLDLYDQIEDGYYTPKYFTTLCKEINKKKQSIDNQLLAIKSFNATKSQAEHYNYPDYMQLITPISTSTTRTKGLQDQYNALYLSDHILLANEITNSQYDKLDIYKMTEQHNKPLCYTINDNYLLLMPLNK